MLVARLTRLVLFWSRIKPQLRSVFVHFLLQTDSKEHECTGLIYYFLQHRQPVSVRLGPAHFGHAAQWIRFDD